MKKLLAWLVLGVAYFIIGIVMGTYGLSAWNAFTLTFWILVIQGSVNVIVDLFDLDF